jgi:hypothetical protein
VPERVRDPLLAVLAISSLERDRLRASKRSSRSKSNKRYLSVPTWIGIDANLNIASSV